MNEAAMKGLVLFFLISATFSIFAQDDRHLNNFEDSSLYILSHRFDCCPDIVNWAFKTIKKHKLNKVILVVPSTYEDSTERHLVKGFRHIFRRGRFEVSVIQDNLKFSMIYNVGYLSFVKLGDGIILHSGLKRIFKNAPKVKSKNSKISVKEVKRFWYRDSELGDGGIVINNTLVNFSGVSNQVQTFNYKTKKKRDITLSPVLHKVSDEMYEKFSGLNANYLMSLRDTLLRMDNRTNEKEYKLTYFSSAAGEINLSYAVQFFVSSSDTTLDAYASNRMVYVTLDTNFNLKNWACDINSGSDRLAGFIKKNNSSSYYTRTMPNVKRVGNLAYPFVTFRTKKNIITNKKVSEFHLNTDEIRSNRVDFSSIDQLKTFCFKNREYIYTTAIPFLFTEDGKKILLKNDEKAIYIIDIIAKGGKLYVIMETQDKDLASVIMVQVLDEKFNMTKKYTLDLMPEENGYCGVRMFYFDNNRLNFYLYPYSMKLDENTAKHKVYSCSLELGD